MGHAALGVCTSPPRHGVSSSAPHASSSDPGSDLGIRGFGWCPDGLTERVIDRLYGDLLASPDESDGPSGPPEGADAAPGTPDGASGSSRLLTLPVRRVCAGQAAGRGGEAA